MIGAVCGGVCGVEPCLWVSVAGPQSRRKWCRQEKWTFGRDRRPVGRLRLRRRGDLDAARVMGWLQLMVAIESLTIRLFSLIPIGVLNDG